MTDPGLPVREVRVERRPEKIGRYQILDRIGKGAMGVVYAAQDERMGREVALKVLMADLDGDPDIRARFFREAQVAAKLVHKNIVTIFDLGEEDGRLFIVMELLRGSTLHDYLRQHPPGMEETVDFAIQICEGLTAASSAGIFHRDIKPGNLFVQRDGSLKILDFGIARLASSNMTASGFIVGTPDYMSPEQARGMEVDGRSDQFSVGAVLYFMLSGRKPFFAPNLPAILHKVVSEEPAPLSQEEAPPALARIVARALSKDSAARYADFPEMLTDLRAFKRRYEAETQALAAAAAGEYRNAQLLFDDLRGVSTQLGLAEPDFTTCVREYIEELPTFITKPPESGTPVVARRATVQPAAARLEQLRLSLGARVTHLRAARVELEEAIQAVVRGDLRKGLGQVEELARRFPDATLISTEASRCRGMVGSAQVREDRVKALLAQSGEERSRGRAAEALALAEQAAALLPQSAPALQMVRVLREELTRLHTERQQRVHHYLDKARKALRKERCAEAEELLQRARIEDPANPSVSQLGKEIVAAQAAHAAIENRARDIAERTAHARVLFADGQHTAAIAALHVLSTEYPEDRAVVAELERQRAEVIRIQKDRALAQEMDALAESAEAALAAGDTSRALTLAGNVLAVQRAHERALRITAVARTRIREANERDLRITRAATHIKKAKEFLERGRFDRAVEEAEQAVALDPSVPEGTMILREASRQREGEKAARERKQEDARLARQVSSLVADGRTALRGKDFVRAESLAKQALTVDANGREAQALLNDVATSRAAVVAPQDDTVDLLALPPDPDDTASIPVAPRDDGFMSALRVAVGDRLKLITARRRATSASSVKPPESVKRP